MAAAFLVLAPGLLAACGGGNSAATGPQATVPDTTVGSPTSYAVPSHITNGYVQRVMNALDAIDGDATRLIVSQRALVPQAVYRLRAINSDTWFTQVSATWADQLSSGLAHYRARPGNQKDKVERVISGRSDCVFAEIQSDYSAVSTAGHSVAVNFVQLLPEPSGHDPKGLNPTPWLINIEGSNSRGLQPSDPCAAP